MRHQSSACDSRDLVSCQTIATQPTGVGVRSFPLNYFSCIKTALWSVVRISQANFLGFYSRERAESGVRSLPGLFQAARIEATDKRSHTSMGSPSKSCVALSMAAASSEQNTSSGGFLIPCLCPAYRYDNQASQFTRAKCSPARRIAWAALGS
jgi:hypothetical protein